MFKKIISKSYVWGAFILVLCAVLAINLFYRAETFAVATENIVLSEPVYQNNQSSPCYVRLQVINPTYTSDKESFNLFILHTDSKEGIRDESWTYFDGYYYYNTSLSPGESTKPLYDFITKNKKAFAEDNLHAKTIIFAQSIPVSNGKSPIDAFNTQNQ